jgi:signal transduction histidine kinase
VPRARSLANMSRENRTPLNAVVGLNYLLRRDDPTPRQRDRSPRSTRLSAAHVWDGRDMHVLQG